MFSAGEAITLKESSDYKYQEPSWGNGIIMYIRTREDEPDWVDIKFENGYWNAYNLNDIERRYMWINNPKEVANV